MVQNFGSHFIFVRTLREQIIFMVLGTIWMNHQFSLTLLKSIIVACQWTTLTFKLMALLFNTDGFITHMAHLCIEHLGKDSWPETATNSGHSSWQDHHSSVLSATELFGRVIVLWLMKMSGHMCRWHFHLVFQEWYLQALTFQDLSETLLMITLSKNIKQAFSTLSWELMQAFRLFKIVSLGPDPREFNRLF